MLYDDDITEKRPLILNPQTTGPNPKTQTTGLNPKLQPTRPKPRSLTSSERLQLPPMPALEDLVQARSVRDELADRPTVPLVPQGDFARDLSRYPTIPLTRHVFHPAEAVVQQVQMWMNRNAPPACEPRVAPLRLPRLKKQRRTRRVRLVLLALFLLLAVLGCVLVSGLYALETTVLAPLAQFFHPVSGDGTGSIDGRSWNLLLLGSDNDKKFVFPEVLTQVMMVIHVDPLKKSVFLLSIPRDSWVAVPGQAGGYKIDQAFDMGASVNHSFDDGVRLARQTIEQDYGIPIDRYAWIGLDGFSSVINTLGGLDIDVTHPLLDDNYPDDTGPGTHASNPYAVKRLYFAPGPQHLTGDQALEYVRSRHADLVGDIGRTQRQQEILEALKKKLNVSTIFNHLSAFFHDLTGKVYTDLSESEMLSVATFARALPANAIGRLTLGPGSGSQDYGSLTSINDPGPDGNQQIVLPNCTTIQPAINRIFGLGDIQSCQVSGGS